MNATLKVGWAPPTWVVDDLLKILDHLESGKDPVLLMEVKEYRHLLTIGDRFTAPETDQEIATALCYLAQWFARELRRWEENESDEPRWYDKYLESSAWKRKRERLVERAGHRCQVCNKRGQLNVHHRTYERVTFEDDADLIVLCRDCHEVFHKNRELAK